MQLARVRARDGASAEDALARIRAQKPLAEKVAVADFVIDTSGTLEEGARRADEALAGVCAKVGVDLARYPLRERLSDAGRGVPRRVRARMALLAAGGGARARGSSAKEQPAHRGVLRARGRGRARACSS